MEVAMQHADVTPTRRDTRRWEKDSKYGTRLVRQAGTNTFRSTVHDRAGGKKHARFPNWTQARKWHEKRLVNVEEGLEPVSTRVTMDELWADFEKLFEGLVASGERSPGTLERRQIQYRVHVRPTFGRMRVQKIGAQHVSRWLAEKRAEKKDVASIYEILRVLFNHAVSRGFIVESPLKRLSTPERPRRRAKSPARCVNDDECSVLIENSLPSIRTLTALYAFTALRQSEGLGLIWDDLDLTEGILRVRAQLSRRKPARRVPPKSANGVREVDLLPELVTLLKRHKAAAFARGHAGASDFVFATADGKPLYYRNVSRDFRKAADRAGLNPEGVPSLTCHDLRHTTISRWIASGLDAVEVARQAGDTVATVTKTYAHQFDVAKRRPEIREKLAAGTSIRLA
jgi:integrase